MTDELREQLGRIVRETWISWAKEQPDIADHPHWLTEWDGLSERNKEVDRRIGEAIASPMRERMDQMWRTLLDALSFVDWFASAHGDGCMVHFDEPCDCTMPHAQEIGKRARALLYE